MKQEDKVALKEFLFGASVAIGLTVVFLVIIFATGIVITETKKERRAHAVVHAARTGLAPLGIDHGI